MTLKTYTGLDPFDVIWKNLFDSDSRFNTITEKIGYPVDIYETETGLRLELAVVGLNATDINIYTESNTLRITHERKETDNRTYLHKGIARRSFDLAWRISTQFDLTKLEAQIEKGLLVIDIPYSEKKAVNKIEIKEIKALDSAK